MKTTFSDKVNYNEQNKEVNDNHSSQFDQTIFSKYKEKKNLKEYKNSFLEKENQDQILNILSGKLYELEKINKHLKYLLAMRQIEIKDQNVKIGNLKNNLVYSNNILEKTKNYFADILVEKDKIISHLDNEISILKNNFNEKKNKTNQLLCLNDNETEEFLKGIESTKTNLENLKEKIYHKYLSMKEKNEYLNTQLIDKENSIKTLISKCEVYELEKSQMIDKFKSELQKQKQRNDYMLLEKDKTINDITMNMSIIIKELNLLRKVKSKSTQENSYKHISSQENNLSDETKNEHRDSNAINLQINESFSKMKNE